MTALGSQSTYKAIRNGYLDQFKISERYHDLFLKSDDPNARLLLQSIDTIVRHDEAIIDLGNQIADKLQRTAAKVAAGQHVNSLGELQRVPVEYDQACAAREAAIENLRHVAAAYRATRPA